MKRFMFLLWVLPVVFCQCAYDCSPYCPGEAQIKNNVGYLQSWNKGLNQNYSGYVTNIDLSYYNVPCSTHCDTAGFLMALQTAAKTGRPVATTSIGTAVGTLYAEVALAGDNFFDMGHLLTASVGNDGPSSQTIRAPAAGNKTIGVGALWLSDDQQFQEQSRGPSSYGYVKPDIQMYMAICTAASDIKICPQPNYCITPYAGTSAAAPCAGATAALLYSYLSENIDPDYYSFLHGIIAATLILAGDNDDVCEDDMTLNNQVGAGVVAMPELFLYKGDYAVSVSSRIQATVTSGLVGLPTLSFGETGNISVAVYFNMLSTDPIPNLVVSIGYFEGTEYSVATCNVKKAPFAVIKNIIFDKPNVELYYNLWWENQASNTVPEAYLVSTLQVSGGNLLQICMALQFLVIAVIF